MRTILLIIISIFFSFSANNNCVSESVFPISENGKKALISNPISMNAACIPGITFCILPLYILPTILLWSGVSKNSSTSSFALWGVGSWLCRNRKVIRSIPRFGTAWEKNCRALFFRKGKKGNRNGRFGCRRSL